MKTSDGEKKLILQCSSRECLINKVLKTYAFSESIFPKSLISCNSSLWEGFHSLSLPYLSPYSRDFHPTGRVWFVENRANNSKTMHKVWFHVIPACGKAFILSPFHTSLLILGISIPLPQFTRTTSLTVTPLNPSPQPGWFACRMILPEFEPSMQWINEETLAWTNMSYDLALEWFNGRTSLKQNQSKAEPFLCRTFPL